MLDSVRSCWPYLFRKAGEHHRESERERKAARGSDCDLDHSQSISQNSQKRRFAEDPVDPQILHRPFAGIVLFVDGYAKVRIYRVES